MNRKHIRPAVMTPIWLALIIIAWHDLPTIWAAILSLLTAEHTCALWVRASW